MRLLLILALVGCNTAAQFDLAAEEILGVGILGAAPACEGGGYDAPMVLLNQESSPVRIGGRRLPAWPEGGHGLVTLSEVTVDGRPASATVSQAVLVAQDPDGQYALVLDRSGAGCAYRPDGPWEARCDFTPCGTRGDTCTVANGCCGDGQVCASTLTGTEFEQQCAVPSDDCGGCGAGLVCVSGQCLHRRFGPIDPEDRLLTQFVATAATLLDTEGGTLAPPVGGLEVITSSSPGLHRLSNAPFTRYSAFETALERHLLSPFGGSTLLHNLAGRASPLPTVVWGMRPGPAASLAQQGPHLFVIRDSAALSTADDVAFRTAACESGGAYVRVPSDTTMDSNAFANTWVPAAIRSHVRLRLNLDPSPGPGPHRIRGRVRLDVAQLVAGGTQPAEDTIESEFDFVVEGAP